jgi:hypothetical protein
MPTVVDAFFLDLRAVLLKVREGAGVIVGLDRDVLDADMLFMILEPEKKRKRKAAAGDRRQRTLLLPVSGTGKPRVALATARDRSRKKA